VPVSHVQRALGRWLAAERVTFVALRPNG
jgi:hypothetical protein